MKTRIGFVSNSSSTSFIVLQKRPDLSQEERHKINDKHLKEMYGDDYVDNYNLGDIDKEYGENIIIAHSSISDDGDMGSDVERLIRNVISGLGLDMKAFEIKQGD